MPNGAQRLLRSPEMRKLIAVPRVSFESMMRKRARTALAIFGGKIGHRIAEAGQQGNGLRDLKQL
jgi:hypothetical protein